MTKNPSKRAYNPIIAHLFVIALVFSSQLMDPSSFISLRFLLLSSTFFLGREDLLPRHSASQFILIGTISEHCKRPQLVL